MKKLLVTTTTFPRWENDSTPTFVKDLVESYRNNFDILVLAPHYKSSNIFETKNGYKVKRYRYFYPYNQENIVYDGGGGGKIEMSPFYTIKLLMLLFSQFVNVGYYRLKGYEIVHAHWIIPQGFIAVIISKIIKTKVILSVHGSDITTLNSSFFKRIKVYTLKNSHLVTVNSHDTEILCQKIYSRNYIVIPMGIDTDIFKSRNKSPNNNPVKLIFVGRFSKEKGIDNLLFILQALLDKHIDFIATIVGSGKEISLINKFNEKNNINKQIRLVGWLNKKDLSKEISKSDIFISTSIREAQGIAIIEALACGVPVFSTDVGGVSDVVKDGYNGRLFDLNKLDFFAESIIEHILNPEKLKYLSNNASFRISEKYNWNNIGSKFSKLFKSH